MSLLAEQNLIGSLLMDTENITKVYSIVEPNMFRSELLGRIYNEYLRAFENGKEINLVVLEQKLRCEAYPQDLIMSEIRECMNNTITSANIESYANAILNDYKAHTADKMLSAIKVTPTNIKTQIGALQSVIDLLQNSKETTSKSLSEIVAENCDKYFKEKEINPLHLGFRKLDDLLGCRNHT